MFKRKVFRDYVYIGLLSFLISTIFSTILLFVGRELFLISLVFLNPIIRIIDFFFGFFLKFYLYDKKNMFKEDKIHDNRIRKRIAY